MSITVVLQYIEGIYQPAHDRGNHLLSRSQSTISYNLAILLITLIPLKLLNKERGPSLKIVNNFAVTQDNGYVAAMNTRVNNIVIANNHEAGNILNIIGGNPSGPHALLLLSLEIWSDTSRGVAGSSNTGM